MVGSWARGEASLDADLDLLLLVTEPARFRDFAVWLPALRPSAAVTWRDTVLGHSSVGTTQRYLNLETTFGDFIHF